VTNLADRYAAAGHEVMLVRFHGEAELQPADPRVRLESLAMRRSPTGVLGALVRFRHLMRTFRPDVVNSHLVHANILTRLLRPVTPMPRLVSSAHNTDEEGRGRMLAYRLTDRLADISTNVSAEAVQAFVDQGALRSGRMKVVHNGIDTLAFAFDATALVAVRREMGLSDDEPVLLAVGRLWEQKDYHNLLRALANLSEQGLYPRLLIVGDGPLRQSLADEAESLGVADRVRFLGVRHDVPALMSACDIFVLSSAWEGFGLVVAEAMACERVVVATDSGGVREVIGDAGYLVPPRDSGALAQALALALRLSIDERAQLGRAGRAWIVGRYSIEATAQRYLDIYQRPPAA
jgi:glycosyltransferase involved in cell wall biosynthesis